MAWGKVAVSFLAPYIIKAVRKAALKRAIYGEIDDFVGKDGFVDEDIMGIKKLNDGEKSIDTYASEYILQKDVREWTDYDLRFLRMTDDYSRNTEKQRKVWEYLNYQRKLKQQR